MNYRGSVVAVLALVSSEVWAAVFACPTASWNQVHSCYVADTCLSCSSSFFFSHDFKSQLCCPGVVKPKQDLPAVPRDVGAADHTPVLLFLVKGIPIGGQFHLGSQQCQPEWQDDERKAFFHTFSAVILRVFVPLRCWSFLCGLQSFPWVVSVHGYAKFLSVTGNREAGVLYPVIWVTPVLSIFHSSSA